MALTQAEIDAIPEEDITEELANELFPPVHLGPTWERGEDGNFILPELTLGWGILGWCTANLLDPITGNPWMFTPEQARFILWFYEVKPRGNIGVRTNRKAVFQRLKGHGKDPMAVALGMAELLGPTVWSHWDPDVRGGCVGKARRSSLVQVVAVSKEQGVGNTMHMAPEMISKQCIEKYNLDIQKEIVQVKGRPAHRMMAVAGSFKSAEGNRPHFVIMNEPHHWTPSMGGDRLYETVQNNIRKTATQGSSILAITNAYVPGEDSVLERMRYAVDQFNLGLAPDPKILYDTLEAHPDAPFDTAWGPWIVKQCAGDSLGWVPWQDVAETFADTSIDEARERRMWYNRVIEPEDAVFSESEWDAIRDLDLTGTKADLNRGDAIVLGFDGGRTDDATALVAIRIRDRLVVPLAIWQSPPRTRDRKQVKWEMDPMQVTAEVHLAFSSYNVKAFYADVQGYDSWIFQWEAQYAPRLEAGVSPKRPIAYDMRGHQEETIRGHEAFMRDVLDRRIWHNGDPILRKHALNARRRTENRYGISFGKESRESPNKIDAYAATICAYLALRALLREDKNEPEKNKTVHFS